jgi:transcriptional regulator with XRE-family HTH domain
MPNTTRKTAALDLHLEQMGIDPRRDRDVQRFDRDIHIAKMIYAARQAAGLTQRQLAQAIGTKQQVISQLEDADYHGHSLSMLQRIAHALDLELEVRFKKPRRKTRPRRVRRGSREVVTVVPSRAGTIIPGTQTLALQSSILRYPPVHSK